MGRHFDWYNFRTPGLTRTPKRGEQGQIGCGIICLRTCAHTVAVAAKLYFVRYWEIERGTFDWCNSSLNQHHVVHTVYNITCVSK